jgi:AraC-like DNA-binding protein
VTDVRHGGTGDAARLICGFLHSEHHFGPILESLPPLVCVRSGNGGITLETLAETGPQSYSIADQEGADWWRASLRYLVSETATPGPGNRAVLARLAEFLFVQVLRWQMRYSGDSHGGWLVALRDAQVGRAIGLLHARPARPWTVEELALEAGTSRATLAKRFVELLGESPIQYLAGWRMHLARHLLRDGVLGIGEIAARVGYESEAAFNRAFRRVVGAPPATWRRTGACLHGPEAAPMAGGSMTIPVVDGQSLSHG